MVAVRPFGECSGVRIEAGSPAVVDLGRPPDTDAGDHAGRQPLASIGQRVAQEAGELRQLKTPNHAPAAGPFARSARSSTGLGLRRTSCKSGPVAIDTTATHARRDAEGGADARSEGEILVEEPPSSKSRQAGCIFFEGPFPP